MCPASRSTSPSLRVLLTRSLPARSTSASVALPTAPLPPSRAMSSARLNTQWERLLSRLSWCSPITRVASPCAGAARGDGRRL
jgi:hypothetical protein